MQTYSELEISTKEAENILFNLYGIVSEPIKLPGEVDYNFRIKDKNSDGFILKISRILDYIEINGKHINAPKNIKDKNGNHISEIIDNNGSKRYVRLLTWVSGRLWSHVNPQLTDLRYSLGETAGNISKTLFNFKHPKSEHNHSGQKIIYIYFLRKKKRYFQVFKNNLKLYSLHIQSLEKALFIMT